MAPLISITIHALSASLGFTRPEQAQQPFLGKAVVEKPCKSLELQTASPGTGLPSLSAVSWAPNRIDIYGLDKKSGNLSHKWWDGYQWGPAAGTLEDLGAGFVGTPAAVTWGQDRMNIFGRNSKGDLTHKYWDGHAWKPSVLGVETLGGQLETSHTTIAATAWGPGRLDIFGISASIGNLLHKYYDGSQWQPSTDLESLGGILVEGVSAVSWGENRLDVIGVDSNGKLLHVYWEGSTWSAWEDMVAPTVLSEPTITSWGENRLDIVGISTVKGELWHTAWDGSKWLAWEILGGSGLKGKAAVTSWTSNRLDIVALGPDGGYYYKFWDGYGWQPQIGAEGSLNATYPKGGKFSSSPTLVSWGPNRLDIFGVTDDAQLGHQTWYGSGWYPEWGFEKLGGSLATV